MLSKEHEQTVEDALELIRSSSPNLETERDIARQILARITDGEEPIEKTLYFLSGIRGLNLSAKRIAAKFPTVDELCTADYDSIRVINGVGDHVMQKVYDALVDFGYDPKWVPFR